MRRYSELLFVHRISGSASLWGSAVSPSCLVNLHRFLDQKDDGCVVDVHHFNSGAQSVLAYATVNGSLVGWDLRSNSNAWTLRHDLRLGLITSFAVDMHQCWLCVGECLAPRSL